MRTDRANPGRLRRRLVAASVFALVFAWAGGSTAGADTQLGGFQVNSTAAAISLVYNQAGFGLPSGSCPTLPIDLSRTTATADAATGHALASVLWPCDFFANLPPQISSQLQAQGAPVPDFPVYPVRAETFYPQGPANQQTGGPAADMTATSVQGASEAGANYGSLVFPAVVTVGQVTSTSEARQSSNGVLSTSTVALHDVDIMGGQIHFDSLKTTVTATSDASTAQVSGGTTYAGLTVLGQPAVIDANGIHFEPKPPSGGSTRAADSSSGAGGKTQLPVAGGLTQSPSPSPSPTASGSPPPPGPIGTITNPIIQQSEKQLEQQLAKEGITFSPSSTIDVVQGASGSREVDGIAISIEGKTLEPYFDMLPKALRDALTTPRCPPSIPNVPVTLCLGLTFDQTITVLLGSGLASAAASPAFQPPPVIPSLPTLGGTGAVSPFNFGGTGFPGTPGSTSPGLLPTVATGTAAGIPISAILLALALGVAAVGAGGMRRFAEMATTAPAAERCELEKT